jgi:small-conductance mechanosensitive channel/CRP-like cAMP-binding protein
MTHAIQDQPALAWSVCVVAGFPLLVILLGELIHRLRHRGGELARTLRLVRNLVLPAAVVWVLVREILDRRAELIAQLGDTLLLLAVVPAALSVLDLVLAARATPGTTWSRFPKLLFQLARVAVLAGVAAFVLAGVWGVDLRGVLTALGVGSLVMALALQDTLSNLVSGLLLVFDRPFEIGDWVRSGDIVGKVVDVNWRAVRLATKDGDLVVIPNGMLGKNVIYNYTRPTATHAEKIEVCFAHEDPPNRVRQALAEIARATPGVLAQPAPDVRVLGYGEQGVSYQIKFWSCDFDGMDRIRDALVTRIHYAAQRHGLSLSQPVHTVVQLDGDAAERAAASRRTETRLSSLSSLLRLPRAALEELEQEAAYRVYAAGETIARAGAAADGMYVILGGCAAVLVDSGAGGATGGAAGSTPASTIEVERLERGELFGNLASQWGGGSPVTIRAVEDVELLVLDARAVLAMAEKNPGFALEMEQILEAQRRSVQRVRAAEPGAQPLMQPAHTMRSSLATWQARPARPATSTTAPTALYAPGASSATPR